MIGLQDIIKKDRQTKRMRPTTLRQYSINTQNRLEQHVPTHPWKKQQGQIPQSASPCCMLLSQYPCVHTMVMPKIPGTWDNIYAWSPFPQMQWIGYTIEGPRYRSQDNVPSCPSLTTGLVRIIQRTQSDLYIPLIFSFFSRKTIICPSNSQHYQQSI